MNLRNTEPPVFLTIRRESPAQPFQWWPVWGKLVRLPGRFWDRKLFSYTERGGSTVLVHEGSGIPVAYGDDEAEALRIAKPLLATEKILRAALYEAAEELKVGPKPKVKVTR